MRERDYCEEMNRFFFHMNLCVDAGVTRAIKSVKRKAMKKL